ncbi:MAG: spore coat protein [Candidatus Petromonas sp.]|jgi:spore coat protein CotF|nr:spore coat protein [Candidatus Petromonas sp.]
MANLMPNRTVFSEREIMNDLLMSEKQIASAYSTGIIESTCPNLRKTLTMCLDNAQKCQYNVFSATKQRGWYQVKEANFKDIQNAQTKYSKILNQLY